MLSSHYPITPLSSFYIAIVRGYSTRLYISRRLLSGKPRNVVFARHQLVPVERRNRTFFEIFAAREMCELSGSLFVGSLLGFLFSVLQIDFSVGKKGAADGRGANTGACRELSTKRHWLL